MQRQPRYTLAVGASSVRLPLDTVASLHREDGRSFSRGVESNPSLRVSVASGAQRYNPPLSPIAGHRHEPRSLATPEGGVLSLAMRTRG
jgi:hypothetical protein